MKNKHSQSAEKVIIRRPKLQATEHKLQPSTVATLKVVRLSEQGAFLDAGTGNTNDDILLHKLQQTAEVQINDMVQVFLYKDPKGRLTASMHVPKMQEGQIARLKVINTSPDGAFLNVGAERGIFMPYAGMRGNLQVGEIVWAKLYTDKSGRLALTMKVEDEIRRASKPAEGVNVGDMVSGSIYNMTEQGAFLFTSNRFIAFLANKEMTVKPRVGQELTARVTYIRDDGRINVSMRLPKEQALIEDANMILQTLRERQGKMPYNDSTAPEVIFERFHLSKAAFKRALGHLMKERKITQADGWTYLNE